MALCKLMQLDFKGQLEGFNPQEAYDEYDLQCGAAWCDWLLELGIKHDEIGDFDVVSFRDWCLIKLEAAGHLPQPVPQLPQSNGN